MENLVNIFIILALACFCLKGVDCLRCFKCLTMDCSSENLECQRVRAFIQSELKPLYYFDDYISPCPLLNDTAAWERIQEHDESCFERQRKEATCTLGRIKVTTTEIDSNGKSVVRYNFASVLGCATRNLILRIKKGTCDVFKTQKSSSSEKVVREFLVEHCFDIATECHEKDYCIDPSRSAVKTWIDQEQFQSKKHEKILIIGIAAVVMVIMVVVLCAGLLKEPVSRPSNYHLSKTNETDSADEVKNNDTSVSIAEEVEPSAIRAGSGETPDTPKTSNKNVAV